MSEKLTDRSEFTGDIDADNDELHFVDKSNLTQSPQGSSFRVKIFRLIKSLFSVQNFIDASILLTNTEMPRGRVPHFRINSALGRTITIQQDSILTNCDIGYSFDFIQLGVGQITIVAGAGVTLIAADGAVVTRALGSVGMAKKGAANTWEVSGDML